MSSRAECYGLVVSYVLGIATAHTLMYVAIHRLRASVTAGIQNLTPLITALLAMVWLHERLSWLQWMGGLTILLGSAWLLIAHMQGTDAH